MSVILAGLWPLVWHYGLAGALTAALLAAAYFSPVFKKDFLWAAGVIAAFTLAFSFGVSQGEKRVQAQWDQSREIMFEAAKQARLDGIRDAARKPHRWLPNKPDRYNRDAK